MGKVKELWEGLEELDFSSIDAQRKLQYQQEEQWEKRAWGKRDNIFSIGKPVEEMIYHEAKNVASSRAQVEILYGWMQECKDRRTRRVGKHWLEDILFERKTVLEEWNEWKMMKNDPFVEKKDFEEREWYKDYSKLTEEEIYKLHNEIEEAFKDIEDKDIFGLFFKDESQNYPYAKAIAEADYKDRFLTATEEKQKEMLNDPNLEIKVVRKQLQGKKEILRSVFLTYRYALRSMKKYTENRERQYILTNPVYVKKGENGQRTTDRITEYHVLFADIDFYSEKALPKYRKMKPKQVEKLIIKRLKAKGLPHHAMAVYGRGLQLWWGHNPIPAYRQEEWRLMMKVINEVLIEFGADTKAMDGVRILRAVGGIHEKTGKKIKAVYYTRDRFDFDEVFNQHCALRWKQYLKDKEKQKQKAKEQAVKQQEKFMQVVQAKKAWMQERGLLDEDGNPTELYDPSKKKKKGTRISQEAKQNVWNYRHANIIAGIFWLTDLRKGQMTGHREFSCFLVRYYTMCISGGNKIEAITKMHELYHSFTWNALSFDEMVERTASAERGYITWLTKPEESYRYKTQTLIDKFEITDEEMSKMRYIVTKERSKELKLEYNRAYNKKTYEKQYAKKKEKNGTISNEEVEEAIKQAVLEYPKMGAEKLSVLVRERIGKCSKDKALKVKKSMIEQGLI